MNVPENAHPVGAVDPMRRVNDVVGRLTAADSASVLVATVVLAVVVGVFHHGFLAESNLLSILQQSVYVGILAAGMSFLLAMRELDLSVGSNFGLSLIVSALMMAHGWTPWLAGLVAVLVDDEYP